MGVMYKCVVMAPRLHWGALNRPKKNSKILPNRVKFRRLGPSSQAADYVEGNEVARESCGLTVPGFPSIVSNETMSAPAR